MDKILVRSNYENCLDAAARLCAYATSKPFEGAFEVNGRQDALAINDLIVFSLHARRLVESIGLKDLANQLAIQISGGGSLSLWKIIGYLIHHDDLLIIRSATRLRMLNASIKSQTKDEFWQTVKPDLTKGSYSESIPPLILFKSDKIGYTMISLADFLKRFSEEIILEVIKKAGTNNLILTENPLEDLDISEKDIKLALSGIRTF